MSVPCENQVSRLKLVAFRVSGSEARYINVTCMQVLFYVTLATKKVTRVAFITSTFCVCVRATLDVRTIGSS